jgi:hypothetical protein
LCCSKRNNDNGIGARNLIQLPQTWKYSRV